MKKLILTLTIALIAMTSKAQDTVYFDVLSNMTVAKSQATNPNLYTVDSSRTDTLVNYTSGVQNIWALQQLYSETMLNTYNAYIIKYELRHMQGAYSFNVDTNFTTIFSGNPITLTNPVSDSIILGAGDVIDFSISNINNNGRYQVVVDVMHTVDTIFVTNISTGLGSDDIEKNTLSFTVYPNPTVDYLNISGDDTQNATFRVFSVSGSLVREGNLENNTIDVTSINNGNYILMLTTAEGKTLTKQFIKQ